jgi:PncC family amidohydrolase
MDLSTLCREIAQQLALRRIRVVFAESCTAGLVSATLARVPGISELLCGSAVTYRNRTKHEWLGIEERRLVDPGPVSETIAQSMATGVLARTMEADLALSVTGHLGPQAPVGLDGQVYIGIARRNAETTVHSLKLTTKGREARQQEAATAVLEQLLEFLKR